MSVLIMNGATGQAVGSIFADPEEVMHDTWGHLDVEPGVKFPGTIICAQGAYGAQGRMIIQASFDNVEDSPWFYDALLDWLDEQDMECGIYEFQGFYRRRRNDEREFVGQIRKVITRAL